jgi:hypothetical protein
MAYKTLGQGRVTNILIIETLTPSNLHQLTQQCYSSHIKMALLIPLTRNTTQFHYMYYVHKDNSSSMKKHDKTTCKIDTTPQLYEGEDLVIKSTPQLFLVMDVTIISIFF